MLQDDVALADVVKNLSEQLQQIQSQFQLQLAEQQATIAEQQAVNAEQAQQIDAMTKNDVKQGQQAENMKEIITVQARQIDVLTRNDVKQDRQVNRLTDNFARLEAEHKVIAALQDTGVALVSVQNFKT